MEYRELQHLRAMRRSCQRRLQILELQVASFGLSAPPHIVIEIEDIQTQLSKIDEEINRYGQPEQSRTRESPITILFLAADPSDATRLRIGQEFREIQEKLQQAKLRTRFRLEQRMSIRPSDISQALLDVEPQVVHFSGHGTQSGELCFEDQSGEAHPVSPDALADLFEQFANTVDCILLNACYSEPQAKALAKHTEYVIGMSNEIDDEAAIAFSIGFYQALGAGRTFDDAYRFGCVQVRLQNLPDYLIPLLVRKQNPTK